MAALASLVAAAVSGWFAVQLLRRYAARPGSGALLHWGASLVMFSVASAMLAVGELVGWTSVVFRVFYLLGAVLNVPWLASGSVRINGRSRATTRTTGIATILAGGLFGWIAAGVDDPVLFVPAAVLAVVWGLVLLSADEHAIRAGTTALLGIFTAVAVFAVLSAAFTQPLPTSGLPEGSELFPVAVRGLAVAGNAVGSVIVILSALVSSAVLALQAMAPPVRRAVGEVAWRAPVEALAHLGLAGGRAARRAGLDHIAKGNLVIALGVLVAASGGAASFLGETAANAVALGVGVSIMYAGFVRTTRPRRSDTGQE